MENDIAHFIYFILRCSRSSAIKMNGKMKERPYGNPLRSVIVNSRQSPTGTSLIRFSAGYLLRR